MVRRRPVGVPRGTSVPGSPGRLKHRQFRRSFTSFNRGPMPINWVKINADNGAKLSNHETFLPPCPTSRGLDCGRNRVRF